MTALAFSPLLPLRSDAAPQISPPAPIAAPPETLHALLQELPYLSETVVDGSIILPQGTDVPPLLYVESGAIELISTVADGGERVIGVFGAGRLIGVEHLYGDDRSPYGVRALGEGKIRRYDAQAVRIAFEEPEVMPLLMKEISTHLQAVQRFAVVSLVDVELRLGNLMLAYIEAAGNPQGASVELPFKRTQPDLAAAIGAGERSINRMMCKWKKDRVLEKNFGHYVIYDQAAIQGLGK